MNNKLELKQESDKLIDEGYGLIQRCNKAELWCEAKLLEKELLTHQRVVEEWLTDKEQNG